MTADEREAFTAPTLEPPTSTRGRPTSRPPACGTTASSTRPTRARVLGLGLSAAVLNAPIPDTPFGVFRM